jgi:DNA-binding response OmpR family regulator
LSVVYSDTPFIALIDDDGHSAHLLTRMLQAHGAPEVTHFASASAGEAFLAEVLADPNQEWPGMVVVDLKAHSGANIEFLVRNQALLRQKGVPLAVMTQTTDRAGRQALHDAGAAAVFFRQADLDAYRHEAAAMVSFWARHQRLDAVGM